MVGPARKRSVDRRNIGRQQHDENVGIELISDSAFTMVRCFPCQDDPRMTDGVTLAMQDALDSIFSRILRGKIARPETEQSRGPIQIRPKLH